MRNLLPTLPFVVFALVFWACGRQAACERELARMQREPPPAALVDLKQRLGTMPATQPEELAAFDEDDDVVED